MASAVAVVHMTISCHTLVSSVRVVPWLSVLPTIRATLADHPHAICIVLYFVHTYLSYPRRNRPARATRHLRTLRAFVVCNFLRGFVSMSLLISSTRYLSLPFFPNNRCPENSMYCPLSEVVAQADGSRSEPNANNMLEVVRTTTVTQLLHKRYLR